MTTMKNIYNNTKKTMVCAGIDPDVLKMDIGKNKANETAIYDFITRYIDIVASSVCSFKAQKAFFDLHPFGHDMLKNVVQHIHNKHPAIPVILDCKIGDIGNTMSAYLTNVFGNLNCDGVVVNPYMGEDVFLFAKEYKEKAFCVLCKTSNEGGAKVQNLELNNGTPLWIRMLEYSMNDWNTADNIIPIVSEINNPRIAQQVREIIPQKTPILFAGVGAQGRDAHEISLLLNSENSGVFVNSSRALMYPNLNPNTPYSEGVMGAVNSLHTQLENYRNNSKLSKQKHIKNTALNNTSSRAGIIVLIGPSGCGKGEVSKRLCTELAIKEEHAISMGTLLRETYEKASKDEDYACELERKTNISHRTPIFKSQDADNQLISKLLCHKEPLQAWLHSIGKNDAAADYMRQTSQIDWLGYCVSCGVLVPNRWTKEILFAHISDASQHAKTAFILDGYPRTIGAAKDLVDFLEQENIPIVKILHMAISKQEMFRRLERRNRLDDNRQALEKRYSFYVDEVLPAIDYLKERLALDSISLIDGNIPYFHDNGSKKVFDIRESINNVAIEALKALGLPPANANISHIIPAKPSIIKTETTKSTKYTHG